MPVSTVSLDALEGKGWFLSQEGLDSLKEQLDTAEPTLEQVIELAKDTDLRELTEKGFRKGDLTKLSQLPSTLVLQVLQIQNIAVPSIQHVEKPRLLRVVFTDGSTKKKWIGAEILGQVESLSLHTPPGTKFLVTKPIDIQEQLLLLGPGMLTCLGGQVQEMIQAWKAGKQFIKRTKGNQTTAQEDLPPPFIPFKIKAVQTTKGRNKEHKQQTASAPGSTQPAKKDAPVGGNDSNKNKRSKEKDGKRKDTPPSKTSKKKDDEQTKKDTKAAKKDGGPGKKDGGSTKNGVAAKKKDNAPTTNVDKATKKDTGSAKKDSGKAKKDTNATKKEAKPAKKDSESVKKNTGSASDKERGPQEKGNKKKPRQASKDRPKQEDSGKSNQPATSDNNKRKNRPRNQQQPPTSSPSQQQKRDSSLLPTAPNDPKPTVLSATSKPFIPSSSIQQQQQQSTEASSTFSSRGRGASHGNRGRGNRGRGRGRDTDQ